MARRAPFCRDVQIIGETVGIGRPQTKQEALDKHGRYRLGAMREAHHELHGQYQRAGVEMPDYQRIGRERARQIKALARA